MLVSAEPLAMGSLSEVAGGAAVVVAGVPTPAVPGDMGHPDVREALRTVLATHRRIAERVATDLQQAAVFVDTVNAAVQLADGQR